MQKIFDQHGEAFSLEIISECSAQDLRKLETQALIEAKKTTGVLNLSNNTNNALTFSMPEGAKKKISAKALGRVKSDATRKAISKARTGMRIDARRGIKLSEETREKIRASHLARENRFANNRQRKIVQMDLDGIDLKTWDSCSDAARSLGKKPHESNIASAARGKLKSAYGFRWRYL